MSCLHIVSCDRDLHFCGTWRHGNHPLSLNFDISPGCGQIIIAANESSLAVRGQIAAQCKRSGTHQLIRQALDSDGESRFCLYWEPLQDQLKLQVIGGADIIFTIRVVDLTCMILIMGEQTVDRTIIWGGPLKIHKHYQEC